MSLTPDQIKSAAKAIHDLETDRLGSTLARTSVLNAITRAFGLGATFSEFANRHANPAKPTEVVAVCAQIIVPNSDADTHTLPSLGLDDTMIANLGDTYTVDFAPAAYGFEAIHVFRNSVVAEADSMCARLTADIQVLIEALEDAVSDEEVEGPVRSLVYTCNDPLHVNFRHMDNDQVCTANIPRSAWGGRSTLDLSDEAALLLFADNIKVPTGYDESDIRVEDVFEEMVFFQED